MAPICMSSLMTTPSQPSCSRRMPVIVGRDRVAGCSPSNRPLKMCAVSTASGSRCETSAANGSSSVSLHTSVTSTTPAWVSPVALPCPGKCLMAEPTPRS
jgi:hypothetical protein